MSVALELEDIRVREGLDVLTLLDAQGKVRRRAHRSAFLGDDWTKDPIIRRVLAGAPLVTGTTVVPADALARESAALAELARIEVPPNERIRDGLVMQAAAVILDDDGSRLGVLPWMETAESRRGHRRPDQEHALPRRSVPGSRGRRRARYA